MSKHKIMVEALLEIANPVKYAMDNLEDGYEIDAVMLRQLENSPAFYRSIAEKALRDIGFGVD